GDTLNFVRFAALLRESGAQTTVYCQPQLLALLQCSPQLGAVYPNSLACDRGFDWQCSLLDVADLLDLQADRIPCTAPYLQPAPQLCHYWQQRLPRQPQRLRIGIAWQGNPEHQADAFRSLPLSCFECLSEVPGVELLSLQSGWGSEQLDHWRGRQPIQRLESGVDQSSGAFMDTAAIMQTLDLVITSDTAIAHLAGGMGLPTWIALGKVPDWRWLLDRDDSPWYPSVRLFRQPRLGDWSSVFARMREELQRWPGAPREA
ncbi:MAG: hypothetical protein KDA45_11070, partial [Planctomycetales bacterium]|nr:hypothetical protein [Planctomycetales bacterium]